MIIYEKLTIGISWSNGKELIYVSSFLDFGKFICHRTFGHVDARKEEGSLKKGESIVDWIIIRRGGQRNEPVFVATTSH